ncbi:response regulator transcription factor [Clostridium senegalense]|uniref:response regulator transcription factor n=1 Tax=Clostridium senegalense TaxID=1465809 RepID=UPI0002880708|nr:response regulator transcription factor [Clostridium senegalense]
MKNKTILIVDDEENIRRLLAAYLSKENYNILQASNGVDAINKVKSNEVDLILLDIMMPVMDGFETLKILRKEYNMPVIMLSAKGEEEDKLLAFGIGVDNYETKPFSPKILVAKINALMKRTYGYDNKDEDVYEFNGLCINEKSHNVIVDNEDVSLTPTEFSLLMYFVKNKDIVLSREQILNGVWGYNFMGDFRVVDTSVKRLREKINDKAKYIQTVRGFGYKFEVKDEKQDI